MGAMKRLLEAVYETLQETEGFQLLGMDQQNTASVAVASEVIRREKPDDLESQILAIARERGM